MLSKVPWDALSEVAAVSMDGGCRWTEAVDGRRLSMDQSSAVGLGGRGRKESERASKQEKKWLVVDVHGAVEKRVFLGSRAVS
jgi:hypothetical protein